MQIYKIYGTEKPDEKFLENLLDKYPELQARMFYEYALMHSFRVKKNQEKEYFHKMGAVLLKLCENYERFTDYLNIIRKEIGANIQNNIEYPSAFITLMRPR